MAKVIFEYATRTPSRGPIPGASTSHGIRHDVEVTEPLTPSKLAQAEQQFLIWLRASNPDCELLEWVAKDAGTGTVFSQYRSHLRGIMDRTETLRNLARQHNATTAADSPVARLTIVRD